MEMKNVISISFYNSVKTILESTGNTISQQH